MCAKGRRVFENVPEQRRRNMAQIRGKDTQPEMTVRRLLHAMGYRYRLHRRDLPGKPDLVFPSRRKIIEVRGCFWHGHNCTRGGRVPGTRADYWGAKIERNQQRDIRNVAALTSLDWNVLEIWECELRSEIDLVIARLTAFLGPAGARANAAIRLPEAEPALPE